MIHISIIGAGLGGLCLAQALQKHGVAFDVYEKDVSPYSRAQGYRLRIDETLPQARPADTGSVSCRSAAPRPDRTRATQAIRASQEGAKRLFAST
jgi:cation diffusion facilitator CzcD-associated flavoprotein CzcO